MSIEMNKNKGKLQFTWKLEMLDAETRDKFDNQQ
jgi:hypothetical protein